MNSDWSVASFFSALAGLAIVASFFGWLTTQTDPAPLPTRVAHPKCAPSPFGPSDLIFCQEGRRAVAYQLRGGRRYYAGPANPQSRKAKVAIR